VNHLSCNRDGRLHRNVALAAALVGVVLVLLCTYLGLGRTNETTVGSLAPTRSAETANTSSLSSESENLRAVEDSISAERVAVADSGQSQSRQEPAPQAKSHDEIEAEAEIDRVSRAYELFRREFDRDTPEVTVYARHLMYRCIAVELTAQGRGEAWQPEGEMGTLPKIGPDEEQFLVGPRIYRVHKSEFPILLKLDEWQASRAPSDRGNSDEAAQLQRASLGAEVRATIETQLDTTLGCLSKTAKPK